MQIHRCQLHHYVGNYSSFLRARAARQLQASQAYKAKQAEIERLQVFVDRFGAKATKASAANSRKKMIEKIKQQMPDVAPPEGLYISHFFCLFEAIFLPSFMLLKGQLPCERLARIFVCLQIPTLPMRPS